MAVSTDPRRTGVSRGMTLLAASAVAVPTTGDTNENVLATIPILGGAMGTNGGIEVRTIWSTTNSVNAKSLRVRLGGAAGSVLYLVAPTTTASTNLTSRTRNRNSASSQVTNASSATVFGSTSATTTVTAVNSAVNQDLVITGQNSLGTETITLESYEVWLLP